MIAPTAEQLQRDIVELARVLRYQVLPEYRELELHGYASGGSGAGGRRVGDSDPTGDIAVGFQQGASEADPAMLSREGVIRHKLEAVAGHVQKALEEANRAERAVRSAKRLSEDDEAISRSRTWTGRDVWEANARARERSRTGNAEGWRYESQQAVEDG